MSLVLYGMMMNNVRNTAPWDLMKVYHTSTFKTYGKSNGLICLAGKELGDQDLLWWLYLWNPFISKFKTLPPSPLPCDDKPYLLYFYHGFCIWIFGHNRFLQINKTCDL